MVPGFGTVCVHIGRVLNERRVSGAGEKGERGCKISLLWGCVAYSVNKVYCTLRMYLRAFMICIHFYVIYVVQTW